MRSTARPPIARPSAATWRCCKRRQRQREALAVGAQRIDRVLHPLRLVGLEPGAEGEHAARQRRARDERGIAGDVRLVGAGGPDHDHLRLGHAAARLARSRSSRRSLISVCRAASACARCACACATARSRSTTPNRMTPSVERQRGEFVPVERREGVEVIRDRMQRDALGARGACGDSDGCARRARAACESPAPRMRLCRTVSGSCPAFPCPCASNRCPGHGPEHPVTRAPSATPLANRMTLTPRRLAP